MVQKINPSDTMKSEQPKSKKEAVAGPPPEESIGKQLPLWSRLCIGSVMMTIVTIMLWVVMWMCDKLTHPSLF